MVEENGYYMTVVRIKEDAAPIDNITKFAWADEDYETVEEWHEYTEEELAMIAAGKEAERKKEVLEALPGVVEELSEAVSTSATDTEDLMDAIAELSELVSNLIKSEDTSW